MRSGTSRAVGFLFAPGMFFGREDEKGLASAERFGYKQQHTDTDCMIAVDIFAGVHREAGTPDPIPNSEVKRFIAHDTAHLYVGK